MEIHELDFEDDFKWQADDSAHHRVCVEGKFQRNLVFYGLGENHVELGCVVSEL